MIMTYDVTMKQVLINKLLTVKTSKITLNTSKLTVKTRKITVKTNKLTVKTSKVTVKTSKLTVKTSKMTVKTSKLTVQTSKITVETIKITACIRSDKLPILHEISPRLEIFGTTCFTVATDHTPHRQFGCLYGFHFSFSISGFSISSFSFDLVS